MNWLVLSDEQMSKGLPFFLLNDEQMSNWLGVEHQPVKDGLLNCHCAFSEVKPNQTKKSNLGV